jgi:hypothetical protein
MASRLCGCSEGDGFGAKCSWLGCREIAEPILGVKFPAERFRKETLERNSSVGAYEEPRINGVPRTLKRGVPNFHDGIEMSNSGDRAGSRSSKVFAFGGSTVGCVITILKAPASDSLDSCIVESDAALRWRIPPVSPASSRELSLRSNIGVEGSWLGVNDASCCCSGLLLRALSANIVSKPAVLGGVKGNTKFGWG